MINGRTCDVRNHTKNKNHSILTKYNNTHSDTRKSEHIIHNIIVLQRHTIYLLTYLLPT